MQLAARWNHTEDPDLARFARIGQKDRLAEGAPAGNVVVHEGEDVVGVGDAGYDDLERKGRKEEKYLVGNNAEVCVDHALHFIHTQRVRNDSDLVGSTAFRLDRYRIVVGNGN